MSKNKTLLKHIPSRKNLETVQKIPKIIFQTHETNVLPERMADAAYSWIDNNPEYTYYFFDAVDRAIFIKKHYGLDTLKIYNSLSKKE